MQNRLIGLIVTAVLISACSSGLPARDVTPAAPSSVDGDVEIESATEVPDEPGQGAGTTTLSAEGSWSTVPPATPTQTAEASSTPAPTPTSMPARPTESVVSATPNFEGVAGELETQDITQVEEATATPASVGAQPSWAAPSGSYQPVNLTRIEDSDPAPPLTILVSTIRVKEDGYYRVTGVLCNDSDQAYGAIGVVGTFFTEELPCSEGRDRQGNPIQICPNFRHGPVIVDAACSVLAPGATCPFGLEIYPQQYMAYLLHPEGVPMTYRQPASVVASVHSLTRDNLGHLVIAGTVANGNPYPVNNARVGGALIDGAGQIVSVGTVAIAGELAPGVAASFQLRIEYRPYASYQIYPEAIRD